MASNPKKTKTCFVIGPIGAVDSETRIHADWLLEEIIEPVFASLPEFKVVRADKISQPGMIDAQVIQHLFDADLVIADLSKLNANAFYEIGIRHMHQKPIIHMQLSDDEIPFDVSLYRAVKFSRLRPSDLRKAKEDLRSAVDATLAPDYKVDNPITRARGQIKLSQDATPPEKVLLEQLKAIQYRLDKIERGRQPRMDKVPLAASALADVDFEEAMKDATKIVLVFPFGQKIEASVIEDIAKLIPPDILDSVEITSPAKGEVTIETEPGFMTTAAWQSIRDVLWSKYRLRTVRYLH